MTFQVRNVALLITFGGWWQRLARRNEWWPTARCGVGEWRIVATRRDDNSPAFQCRDLSVMNSSPEGTTG
jgi:hypothetical protein